MLKQLQNIWQAGKMEIPSGCLIIDRETCEGCSFYHNYFPEAWFKELFKNMLTLKHVPSLGTWKSCALSLGKCFGP